jgi:hypothetical protein
MNKNYTLEYLQSFTPFSHHLKIGIRTKTEYLDYIKEA